MAHYVPVCAHGHDARVLHPSDEVALVLIVLTALPVENVAARPNPVVDRKQTRAAGRAPFGMVVSVIWSCCGNSYDCRICARTQPAVGSVAELSLACYAGLVFMNSPVSPARVDRLIKETWARPTLLVWVKVPTNTRSLA